MARFKTVAGYFKEVIEKQIIKISVNKVVLNENGTPAFEEDKVTPILEMVLVDAEVDVKNIVWVEQVNIPFTQEEEEARDAEEEMYEYEKLRPVPLTDRQEMDLLLESGPEAVKAKRAEHQKAMDEFLVGHTPLFDKITKLNNKVSESEEKLKENAIVEG